MTLKQLVRRPTLRTSAISARRPSVAAMIGAAVSLLVLGLALTACGSPGAGDDGASDGTAESSGEVIAHPQGEDELVLRVETGGGLAPVEYSLTLLPEFSLLGDGCVIETGPQILIYPGPALPNLQTTLISEEAVQRVLQAAGEAGLYDPAFDYGQPTITDVGGTTFTINADGQTFETSIWALGWEDQAGGITEEQEDARGRVSDFRNQLIDLTTFQEGEIVWEPYDYSALDVFGRSVDVNGDSTAGDGPAGEVAPNRLEWPLADLATAGEEVPPEGYRRLRVTGPDLETLQPLLEQATVITIWESEGQEYNLFFRPVLPDEL